MPIEVSFEFYDDGDPLLRSTLNDGTWDVLEFLFTSMDRANIKKLRDLLGQDEFYFGENISHAEALAEDGDTVRVWGPDDFMDTHARLSRTSLIAILDDWEQFLNDRTGMTRTYDD